MIIYTKTGCPWCLEALHFLRSHDVVFEEREVLGNKVYFDELVKKSGQTKTPTIDLDGEILADTDAEAIEVFLKQHRVL